MAREPMNTKLVSLLGALLLLTFAVPAASAGADDCLGQSDTDPQTKLEKCTGVCSDQQPGDECTGVCTDGSCEPVCDLNLIPCDRQSAPALASADEECDGYQVGDACVEHDCRKIVPGPVTVYNPLTGAPITIDHPAELCY